jgi:hypothetical protein
LPPEENKTVLLLQETICLIGELVDEMDELETNFEAIEYAVPVSASSETVRSTSHNGLATTNGW